MADAKEEETLYSLFYNNLPSHRSKTHHQSIDARAIAADLNISHQSVYGWIERNKVPAGRFTELLTLPGSTLTVEKLLPYCVK
ncbi:MULTISPECIES: hypothetical protein [unclassified Labrenzia]|uniref:hypothetical protein n=1 Tax=unclassified Labrenzia TaxID=2648686 RepID=UPI0004B6FB95|nr:MULTISPECIES: hypothetical protein [unclassified Labrenzia]